MIHSLCPCNPFGAAFFKRFVLSLPCSSDVSTINWDDWADRKTSGEAYLLGRTADAVYLLRFGGTQLFADVPACAEARADFLAAGRAMLQSFLDQNGIEPNPYWQEIYSQYAAG